MTHELNWAKLQDFIPTCKHMNTQTYTEFEALQVLKHNIYIYISTYVHIAVTYNLVLNAQMVEDN